ncbi:MauE/DoxX family redox-associated membrane protein [Mucilaginibacter sp. PAMB04168]|uniref:MauE/DoxX family redox-associated membrane protein n=1 Tax=Mucilaginibacter sp. PAMB04168 TaxID=3138567 RepID=UPI0031F65ED5
MKRLPWLYEVFTYLLALLFLFTALSKLVDFQKFVKQMNNQVFPKAVSAALVILVPLIELIATALLVRIKTRMTGLWLSLALMSAFTVYVGLVTLRVFPRVPCSCAGVFEKMSWGQHLLLNMMFTLIAFAAILLGRIQDRVSTPGVTQ